MSTVRHRALYALFTLNIIAPTLTAAGAVESLMSVQASLQELHERKTPWSLTRQMMKTEQVAPGTMQEWLDIYGHVSGQFEGYNAPDGKLYRPQIIQRQFVIDHLSKACEVIQQQLRRLNATIPMLQADYVKTAAHNSDTDAVYVYKKRLKGAGRIFFWGDLHGDIQCLIATLYHLARQNIIDNDLKIRDAGTYFVFGGDFVDRGNYGIEVLTLLCQLFTNNPDNVILIRGNHETQLILQGGLEGRIIKEKVVPGEIPTKYKSGNYLKIIHQFKKLISVMPVVAYLDTESHPQDFIQCCHGGFEAGWSPKDLLSNKNTESAALISGVDRSAFLRAGGKFEEEHQLLKDTQFIKGNKEANTAALVGFMWSEFTSPCNNPDDPEALNCSYNHDRGALRYGSKLINALPELRASSGTELTKVIVVLRAHQHNASMPQLWCERASASQQSCGDGHGYANQSVFVINRVRFEIQDAPGKTTRQQCAHTIPIVTTVATSQYTPSPSYIELSGANKSSLRLTNTYLTAFATIKTVDDNNLDSLATTVNNIRNDTRWLVAEDNLNAWKNQYRGRLSEKFVPSTKQELQPFANTIRANAIGVTEYHTLQYFFIIAGKQLNTILHTYIQAIEKYQKNEKMLDAIKDIMKNKVIAELKKITFKDAPQEITAEGLADIFGDSFKVWGDKIEQGKAALTTLLQQTVIKSAGGEAMPNGMILESIKSAYDTKPGEEEELLDLDPVLP